jgi:NOL1/NOP2/sun family putative RNA methylase
MKIPEKLKIRLGKLGLDESVYEQRTKKCILSRERLTLEKVPWYEHAYFVDDKNDDYVFDPVSIVPCLALDPQKNDRILDMCAAPGTKTFILSFMSKSRIVANDINTMRVKRLKCIVKEHNINADVTNISGRKVTGSFNKILVDAPCSGEGMVNKKEKLFRNWSEKRIKILSKKQKKLIAHAFELLEKNGTLVYSTCTFEPEENEEVVDFLLKKFKYAKLADVDVNITHSNGLTEWNDKKYDNSLDKCYRIYPQHNETGGFFVAKIKKT